MRPPVLAKRHWRVAIFFPGPRLVQIVITGVNHVSAPLSIRERVFVADDDLAPALGSLRAVVDECFVLSTCNRTEVYARAGHEFTGADLLRRWLAVRSGLSQAELERYGYVHAHEAAVSHAFRVASGLDSMIVGEDQILGQMRRAVAAARDAGALGPLLDRLASSALSCGKRVRTATQVAQRPASVVSVAVDTASRVRGTLAGAQVLVIGSGETASLAVGHLLRAAPARLTVVNRTAESAAALALAHGVDAAAWEELPRLLATADLVMSCTASSLPILAAATVRAARQDSADRRLTCVDLGVPRDIDPRVSALEGVTLIDTDEIGAAAGMLDVERRGEVAAAEEVVVDEVERFMSWWRERDVAPAITRLHAHARHIGDVELDRALSRLPELSDREREVIRTLASRITSKLLHEPTVALKRDPEGPNMAMMLDRLFNLTSSDEHPIRDDAARVRDGIAPSSHHRAE
jgi:glutamyl-tRNA reductase